MYISVSQGAATHPNQEAISGGAQQSAIGRLFQEARERARTVENAAKIAAHYQSQGATQQDLMSPHISMIGFTGAPQTQTQTQGEGGAFSAKDVHHFLDVRINALNRFKEDKRKGRVFTGEANKPTEAIELDEDQAQLQRLLESGVVSGKLLERSHELMQRIAVHAATLSDDERAMIRTDLEDAADQAHDQYTLLSAEQARSKQGSVLQALEKQLRDTIEILDAAGEGRVEDRQARVREARRRAARRPGADAKRRRRENREAAAAEAALRLPEEEAAVDALDRARNRVAVTRAAEEAQLRADAAAAAAAARGGPRRRGAADVGPALLPLARSPALQRAEGARRRAEQEVEAAEDDLAPYFIPNRLPARGTDPYRDLVSRAFAQPRLAALREVARAYDVRVPANPTKAGLRALLLLG